MNTPKTVKELLLQAKGLIDKPENWIQGTSAACRTDKKWFLRMGPSDLMANCFCSVGALTRVISLSGCTSKLLCLEDAAIVALNQAVKDTNGFVDGIVWFNDRYEINHSDVMRVWDRAIEKAS